MTAKALALSLLLASLAVNACGEDDAGSGERACQAEVSFQDADISGWNKDGTVRTERGTAYYSTTDNSRSVDLVSANGGDVEAASYGSLTVTIEDLVYRLNFDEGDERSQSIAPDGSGAEVNAEVIADTGETVLVDVSFDC